MNLEIKLKVGELLLKKGLITEDQLNKALEEHQKTGKRIGDILVELGFIDRETLEKTLSEYKATLSFIEEEWDPASLDKELAKIVPERIASMFGIVPIKKENSTIVVASTDVLDISALDYVRFATGYNVKVVITTQEFVENVYNALYGSASATEILKDIVGEPEEKEENEEIDDVSIIEIESEEADTVSLGSVEELAFQAPVVRLINFLLTDAITKGASDIHIEPYEKRVRIRFRIDGILYDQMSVSIKMKEAIIARVKILAKLNIVERRIPQDGRMKVKVKNREADIRVSTLPTVYGEKVVMRILDKTSLVFDLDLLGFEENQKELFERMISKPYGMILITGPTGSGKTTTLYSALKRLNKPEVNIMTVEDPVEYNFEGINQVNVNEAVGLTFASALRAFLRQDPDIILVGEIRDQETADIAIKAALTGHLVFSTLHTNNAPATVTRLIDMGVEPFLVSSSLILVVAQRLVRRICQHCKEEITPDPDILRALNITDNNIKFYRGKGCSNCRKTGYKGRIAVYEMMEITDEMRKAIVKGAPEDEIREMAKANGMVTLREAGIIKAQKGLTTLEEVLRATA
ncbi:MAG: type IV-A pilus assembly ATPase PilB [Deferribacteres bacterium]|nr:type IV-A pilus assembly ATPase PilB [Deferribacteres bacterium]